MMCIFDSRLSLTVIVASATALVVTACANTPTPTKSEPVVVESNAKTKPSSTSDAFAGVWRHPSDPRIGGFVSKPWTFSTTSYWIEGDTDLILVDTQFLPHESLAFVDAAEAATGKTARLAVALHANPDKFNGTDAFQKRGIAVFTSEAVAALIPSVHEKRLAAFGERYAPHYPTTTPRPHTFAGGQTTLSVPGASLTLHAVGAGCSDAHVVAVFDDDKGCHVFAGDLLANGSHAWLELGRTDAWLTRLDEIDALKPTTVYPGRGLPDDGALVQRQRTYLNVVIDAVKGSEPTLPVKRAQWMNARSVVVEAYPDLRFPVFLNIGLPAESERQARLVVDDKAK